MNKLRIGIAGLGTVAQGVLHLVRSNGSLMTSRTGVELVVQRIASRSAKPGVDLLGAVFSTNVHDLVADPEVDVILELIGGEGLAKDLIESALAAGKPVVTANKAVIAAHGNQLLAGGNVPLRFEAAVAGAIPIIQSLRQGLAANRIDAIYGIINGTCNYMLTVMEEEGLAFEEVLAQAQALGYAEADPAFDIQGTDAAHKLTILAALGFGTSYDFSALYVEGITQIAAEDIQYAKELGFKIKHLGIAVHSDAGLETRVHPALVPESALLASVNGVMNAVQVVSDGAGETLFSGPGAGGAATASAVLADVLSLGSAIAGQSGAAAQRQNQNQDKPKAGPAPAISRVAMDDIASACYLRIPTVDRPGVFAQVASALSAHSISIEAVIQKEQPASDASVSIVIMTNRVVESVVNAALKELSALDTVVGEITRIRVAPTH
ncbi:MAG: homoserine dehydrogenase [Gammaproteobacteria bacterium]|nr:homoserine dehydrogenase [Gammaproteobacteria bacterium]MBT5682531.1 homoserine dehydrogenase [Gammaproteobacteria bacterium]MBT6025441.1 homoserine dehydrogenase [Gammaproteobacteria bacterium]